MLVKNKRRNIKKHKTKRGAGGDRENREREIYLCNSNVRIGSSKKVKKKTNFIMEEGKQGKTVVVVVV